MALGSSIADALPSGIEKLRQQMAGLSSKAADAMPPAAAVARPALLQQALDNAPALLELGTMLVGRLRGAGDNVAGRLAPAPKPAPPRRPAPIRHARLLLRIVHTDRVHATLSPAPVPAPGGDRRCRVWGCVSHQLHG